MPLYHRFDLDPLSYLLFMAIAWEKNLFKPFSFLYLDFMISLARFVPIISPQKGGAFHRWKRGRKSSVVTYEINLEDLDTRNNHCFT